MDFGIMEWVFKLDLWAVPVGVIYHFTCVRPIFQGIKMKNHSNNRLVEEKLKHIQDDITEVKKSMTTLMEILLESKT